MPIENMFGMPDEAFLEKELTKYRRNQDDSPSTTIFKFVNGITTIRVLPPTSGAPAWHREIYQHWNVKTSNWDKGLPLTCPDVPRSGTRTCPICAKNRELLESKNEAAVKLGNDIRRQMKVMMNILVFSAPPGVEFESGKVYLVMAPKTVVTQLLGYDKDEQSDFPDITGIRSAMAGEGLQGYMFKVIRSGKGLTATTYTVQPTPKRVDLVEQLKPKTLEDLKLYDLFNLYPSKPLNELQEIADLIKVPAETPADTSLLDKLQPTAKLNYMDEINPPEV